METHSIILGQLDLSASVGPWAGAQRALSYSSLEEGMATHSSILVWSILWTEEPGGLQSIGSQSVRHD